jgi:lysozyme
MTNQYITDILVRDEAVKLKPYKDTVGKLTIGCGRNLDDVGISYIEAMQMLSNDIAHVETQAQSFPWYAGLTPARQAVILSMIFNMGLTSFSGFTNTIKSIASGNYEAAAQGMEASKWAKQVGKRATRLSSIMRSGVIARR